MENSSKHRRPPNARWLSANLSIGEKSRAVWKPDGDPIYFLAFKDCRLGKIANFSCVEKLNVNAG
jgi:hypothetical protein